MTATPAVQPDPELLARQLEQSYQQVWQALNLLEPAEWEQPCLHAGWSPKVLLAHIAFWDDFQTRRMQAALHGAWAETIPRPAQDNEARAVADAARAWDDIVAEADRNRQRLVDFCRSVTADQIRAIYREGGKERPVLQILLPHMAHHAREHAAELVRYSESRERWG